MDGEMIVLPERIKPKRKYNRQPNFLTTNKKDELTVMEKKILYLVMNQLDDSDITRDKYTIQAKDINTNTKHVVNALRKVLSRRIKFVDNHAQTREIVPFIGYDYHKFRGLITMQIHPEALPVFYDKKKGYTSFQLQYAMLLSSKYSQKLYEILSRWRDKKMLRLDIVDLQRDMCAEDKEYGNFKRRCLNQAMKEINEKTEITFSYTEEKQGRRVVSLILCKVEKDKEAKQELLTEINELQQDAQGLSYQDIKFFMSTTYRHYTFAPHQVETIAKNKPLFLRFIELDTLLMAGQIPAGGKLRTTPTRYMATCLFKKQKQAA